MSAEVSAENPARPLQVRSVGPTPTTGSSDGSHLYFLHGFGQNGNCAGPFPMHLSDRHLGDRHLGDRHVRDAGALGTMSSIDLPGHGGSTHLAESDLARTAKLIARDSTSGTFIGYSMGGRIALRLCLEHPGHVERLVLIGATAGIDEPELRSARREADLELATRIESVGIERFVAEWLDQPLFEHLPVQMRFIGERLSNQPGALATSLRLCGTGSMDPLWERLSEITCPVLVIAGALDDRYCGFARRLVDSIGDNARCAIIPDAGHSAHLEQPAHVGAEIGRFLSDTGS